jgi:mRNA interferase MazF
VVTLRRADVVLVDFGEPQGSAPAYVRPALVIQANDYNTSRLVTIIVAVITSNTALARFPDNVSLPEGTAGLDRPSVVNVTRVRSIDRRYVIHTMGALPERFMADVDAGIRRVLGL